MNRYYSVRIIFHNTILVYRIGGGGSILAIPLLLYFVGLANGIAPGTPEYSYITHLTLGTTALAEIGRASCRERV